MNDTRRPEWAFSAFELQLLGMFAALLVAATIALRFPIKVPGHSGALCMAVLVTARAVVPRRLAATTVGLLSGLLAAFAGLGDRGSLVTIGSYMAGGVGVDLVALASGFPTLLTCTLAGLIGNLMRLGLKSLVEIWIGIPMGFVVLGRAYATLMHVVFGLAGGALGYLVIRALRRAGYFAYLAEKR
jgi:hypothetical protein